MPTYSYRCKSCEHHFEEWQKISDDPLVTCPSCGKNGLVRVIGGGAGLIFKGSGFYLTDYKKNSSTTKSEGTERKTEKPTTESTPKTEKKD
jgi:putative FmdB family regulatory protein